jgi:hypothetical protein
MKEISPDELEKLRFPIGTYEPVEVVSDALRTSRIGTIENFPEMVSDVLHHLYAEDLQKPYRPHGWNGFQVVHHVADSHMNAYIRFKLALTEEEPTIRPYFEDRWASCPDGLDPDIEDSLTILKGVHHRWARVLNWMKREDFDRKWHHPESNISRNLDFWLGMYDWHCKHHLGHLKLLMKK